LTRLQLKLVKDDPSGSLLDTKGAPEREVGRLLQDRNHSLVGLAILELLGAWLMNGQACTRASEPSLPVGETIGPSLDISFYFRTGTAPEGLYVSDTFLRRGVEFIEEQVERPDQTRFSDFVRPLKDGHPDRCELHFVVAHPLEVADRDAEDAHSLGLPG